MELLQQGFEGGQDAARTIVMMSYKYINIPQSTKLMVHVFANVVSLANTLCQTNIIAKPELFNDFVDGFNSVDELVTFINVGPGRDLAELKINGSALLSKSHLIYRAYKALRWDAPMRKHHLRRRAGKFHQNPLKARSRKYSARKISVDKRTYVPYKSSRQI